MLSEWAADSGSLRTTRRDAVRSVAFRNAQTLGRFQQIQIFGANSIHCCEATHSQFILSNFLCTLQNVISGQALINILQHSIPGAWLKLTRTGFAPASQTDLASPHVQHFVMQSVRIHVSSHAGSLSPIHSKDRVGNARRQSRDHSWGTRRDDARIRGTVWASVISTGKYVLPHSSHSLVLTGSATLTAVRSMLQPPIVLPRGCELVPQLVRVQC